MDDDDTDDDDDIVNVRYDSDTERRVRSPDTECSGICLVVLTRRIHLSSSSLVLVLVVVVVVLVVDMTDDVQL